MRRLQITKTSSFVLLFLWSTLLLANVPSPEDLRKAPIPEEARQFFYHVWSPFCPGQSLHDCTSSQSMALRKEIGRLFDEGKSKEEVLAILQETYGDKVSMIPPTSGFSLTAYLLPFFVLFLTLLVFLRKVVVPRKKFSRGPLANSLPSDDLAKVDKWLKK